MFETVMSREVRAPANRFAAARPVSRTLPSHDGGVSGAWLDAMLDEVDYPMLLVGARRQLLHANHAARSSMALDGRGPLQLRDGRLGASREADDAALVRALADATQRGMRCMLTLGGDAARVHAAVVPVAPAVPGDAAPALLVLGRTAVSETLSIRCFAHAHGLTPAEERVLMQLCGGESPAGIARRQGVALSTVRSHVGSVRAKTGAVSIRGLCEQVALLPPMVCALRAPCVARLS